MEPGLGGVWGTWERRKEFITRRVGAGAAPAGPSSIMLSPVVLGGDLQTAAFPLASWAATFGSLGVVCVVGELRLKGGIESHV